MKRFRFVLLFLMISAFSFSAGKYDLIVALDGSGDYKTNQQAVDTVGPVRQAPAHSI